jgi:ubiquinone/menaquinone biosynthesis C-methylase UbiE
MTNSHLLSDTATELDRLRVQARFWERDAENLVSRMGVGSGWRCLDLGCGAMGILRVLSRAVGDEGSVVGLDNNPRMLEAAGRWAVAQRMTNVDLVVGDAFATALPRSSFDLVHARFMFCPLGAGESLLREMIDLTKPGGIVAVQEPIAASWQFHPRCEPVEKLTDAIVAAFRAGGGNLDAGATTFSLLRDAGLEDVSVGEHAVPLRADSFDTWWTRTRALSGPLAAILASLPEPALRALRERLEEATAPYRTAAGLELPGVSLVAAGRR